MAFIVKSGKRGRPLKFDVAKESAEFWKRVPAATLELDRYRNQTSGRRDQAIFGSLGLLPDWAQFAAETLRLMEQGYKKTIDYATAKAVRNAIQRLKNLGSKNKVRRATALTDMLLDSYRDQGEYISSQSLSDFAKRQVNQMNRLVGSMTLEEQAKFFDSVYYQDPITAFGDEYEHVIEWSQRDSEKRGHRKRGSVKMDGREAMLYLIKRRYQGGKANNWDRETLKKADRATYVSLEEMGLQ